MRGAAVISSSGLGRNRLKFSITTRDNPAQTPRPDPQKSSFYLREREGEKSSAASRVGEWEEMFDRSGNERQTSSSGLFDPPLSSVAGGQRAPSNVGIESGRIRVGK